MLFEALGSLSAVVLASSLGVQLYQLWRDGGLHTPRRSLLIVQVVAAAGFFLSSAVLGGPALALVSALLLASAAAALVTVPRRRRSRLPGTPGRVIWLASMNLGGRSTRESASEWHPASASTR